MTINTLRVTRLLPVLRRRVTTAGSCPWWTAWPTFVSKPAHPQLAAVTLAWPPLAVAQARCIAFKLAKLPLGNGRELASLGTIPSTTGHTQWPTSMTRLKSANTCSAQAQGMESSERMRRNKRKCIEDVGKQGKNPRKQRAKQSNWQFDSPGLRCYETIFTTTPHQPNKTRQPQAVALGNLEKLGASHTHTILSGHSKHGPSQGVSTRMACRRSGHR